MRLRRRPRARRDFRPEAPLDDGVVALRLFTPADAHDVTVACQDPDIARWTSAIPFPYRERDARDWIAFHPEEWASGRGAPFAVVDADDGRLLGACGLHGIDRRAARGEIGYWVAAPERGRGVATRSVHLVTEWAFTVLGLAQIDLLTFVGNVASERVATRAGYRFDGTVEEVQHRLHPSRRSPAKHWVRRSEDVTTDCQAADRGHGIGRPNRPG